MLTTYIFVSLAADFCTSFDTSGLNFIRRPSIPLHRLHLETYPQIFRRFNKYEDVNYRKTKDVYNTGSFEAIDTFDKITYRTPFARNGEPNDEIAKMADKKNENDLNKINNYIGGRRNERNEGQERDEKFERNDRNKVRERNDREVRCENSERREWNVRLSHAQDRDDKRDWKQRNSHLERLVQNVHGVKEGSPVHRMPINEMRDTAPWAESGVKEFKSEIFRNIHKLSQEDRKLQLDKFRRELKWLPANADDTMGIGIQM